LLLDILLFLNNGGPEPNSTNLVRGMTDSDPRFVAPRNAAERRRPEIVIHQARHPEKPSVLHSPALEKTREFTALAQATGEAGSVGFTTTCDAVLDAANGNQPAVLVEVVSAVGIEGAGPVAWAADTASHGWDAVQ